MLLGGKQWKQEDWLVDISQKSVCFVMIFRQGDMWKTMRPFFVLFWFFGFRSYVWVGFRRRWRFRRHVFRRRCRSGRGGLKQYLLMSLFTVTRTLSCSLSRLSIILVYCSPSFSSSPSSLISNDFPYLIWWNVSNAWSQESADCSRHTCRALRNACRDSGVMSDRRVSGFFWCFFGSSTRLTASWDSPFIWKHSDVLENRLQ